MDETVCTECEALLDAEGGGHKIRCSEHPVNKTSYGEGSVIPGSGSEPPFQTVPPVVRRRFATPSAVMAAVKGPQLLPEPKIPPEFEVEEAKRLEEQTEPPPTVRPPGRPSASPTVVPSDIVPRRNTTEPMPAAPVTIDPTDPETKDTDPSAITKSERPTDPVPAVRRASSPSGRGSSPDDLTPTETPSGLMRASKPVDSSSPPLFGPEQRSQSGLRLKNGVTTVPAPKADGGTDNGST